MPFQQRLQVALFIILCEFLFILYYSFKFIYSRFWIIAALFGAQAPPPEEQWGNLTSLYSSLTTRQVFFLQLSMQWRYAAQYDAARSVFQYLLPVPSSLPILAFERATLYEMEGRDDMAASCLQEAMKLYPGLGPEISSPVFRLMEIRFASAELLAYGKLPQALAAARKLHPWLESQQLENYTDVTTQCYSHYQDIMKVAKLNSNWLDCSVDGNLPRTLEESRAASMSVVRRSLQAQRKFSLCRQLVKQESGLYSDDDERSLLPFQEFLECDWVKTKSSIVVYWTVFLQTFYAQKLMELGRRDQAAKQLYRAEASLRKIGGRDISKYNARLHLLLELTWARVNVQDDPVSQIENHIRLAGRAAALGDRPIQRNELLFAFRKADALVDHTPPKIGFLQARQLKDQTIRAILELESEQTGSAFFMCPTLSSLGLFANTNGFAAEWIELFEIFQTAYPDCNIPTLSRALTTAAISAYQALQDEAAVANLKSLHNRHLASCPYIKCRSDGKFEAFIDGVDSEYFREWGPEFWPEQAEWPISLRYRLISMVILLRWVRRDFADRHIDAALGAQILKFKPSADQSFEQWLEQADATNLQDIIYGPAASPIEQYEWEAWFAIVGPWLRRNDLPPSVMHRHNLLKEICNSRMFSLTSHPPPWPAPIGWLQKKICEARSRLDIMLTLHPKVVRDQEIRTCKLSVASSITIAANNPIARETRLVTDNDLSEVQDLVEQVAQEYRELNEPVWLLRALSTLYSISWPRCHYYKSLPNLAPMKYIEEADEVFQNLLGQYLGLPGEQSFAAILEVTDDLTISDLYERGIATSFYAYQQWVIEHLEEIRANPQAILPQEAQMLQLNFVNWAQKAKARTTTRIFSFTFNVPLGSALNSAEAQALINQEEKMIEKWSGDLTMVQRLRIRADWRDLRQQMLKNEALRPVIEIQSGVPASPSEVHHFCSIFDEDVVMVDFVRVALWDAWDLAVVIRRNGIVVTSQILPITLKQVEDWVTANLELNRQIYELEDESSFFPLKSDRSTRELNKLSGLLSSLEQYTNPGELLVFCPVQALNRVPLHALPIGDEICIQRNPVVYCQNFSLLRLCFVNRFQNGGFHDLRSVIYNPLQNERETAAAVAQLAETLETQVAVQDVSKTPREDFLSKIEGVNLIHFHGHVRFDDTEPLRHHLELVPIRDDDEGNQIPLGADEVLTAKNVFDARIRPGAHITTISCKSAQARVTEANDLLGLGTAFHCAGAGSMVSTLWNIWGPDGLRLSQQFYGHLFEQGKKVDAEGGLPELVDMARAMQHAILKLRVDANGEVRAPYHWAGFVFNGAWLIQNPVPGAFT